MCPVNLLEGRKCSVGPTGQGPPGKHPLGSAIVTPTINSEFLHVVFQALPNQPSSPSPGA